MAWKCGVNCLINFKRITFYEFIHIFTENNNKKERKRKFKRTFVHKTAIEQCNVHV